MRIYFLLDFFTHFGESIYISGNIAELGNQNPDNALCLTFENGICKGEISLSENDIYTIKYKYFLRNENGIIEWECSKDRILVLANEAHVVVKDSWRSIYNESNIFGTSAFVNVFNKRNTRNINIAEKSKTPYIKFRFNAPQINKNQRIGILGNQPTLGNWNKAKIKLLIDKNFPAWEATIRMKNLKFPIEYKYVIVDPKSKEILFWEEGDNRKIEKIKELHTKSCLIQNDEYRSFPTPVWKGVGVSIPVFSLRSNKSFGIGDFLDLKLLAKWAKNTDIKMIQILPINDTTATKSWTDSYPYAAISIFALHPIYLNIEKHLHLLSKRDKENYFKWKTRLNKLEKIDYENTLKHKFIFAKKIFKKVKNPILIDEGYNRFYEKNKFWLKPYAAFCILRDNYKTARIENWESHNSYKNTEIEKLTDEDSSQFETVCFHYFLQYYLHLQLKEAIKFAHKCGVAIKGDIPIGICKTSVEAWKDNSILNMDMQAGAPPDDFAKNGQNWNLPTYKWAEMKKDNYLWWRRRFENMANYFDAYRIDHILGFFRIWQIHNDNLWGLLGHFNPALLFTIEELNNYGLWFDYDRMCLPYIREHFLFDIFKDKTDKVKKEYLYDKGNGVYELKENLNSQNKIEQFFTFFNTTSNDEYDQIKQGLMQLCAEVLFIPIKEDKQEKYHPRISLHETYSYQELDHYSKEALNKIYIDFYYHRHNEFWKNQAMQKLPTLIQSTNMLVCGEDLGMIPSCVPDIMKKLNILSLEIQRMPKDSTLEFGHPADAPYLSVCTTSTHDMSTMRMWWEEDRAKSQRFYNNILGRYDNLPYSAEFWLCKEIIIQHLYSPAMWTIFPLQDLLAMDKELRWEKTKEERINIPSNPKHYWRYRMHLSLEKLLKANDFNTMLKNMICESKRN